MRHIVSDYIGQNRQKQEEFLHRHAPVRVAAAPDGASETDLDGRRSVGTEHKNSGPRSSDRLLDAKVRWVYSRIRIKNHKESTMAYTITDACVACGSCLPECPVEAISEGDIYVIDPELCISCGACADVCPSGAILAD